MGMSDDAKRFRNRAIDCRALAAGACSESDRIMLEEIAEELDEEAERLRRGKGPDSKKAIS